MIRQDAELRFLKTAKILADEQPGHRCLYLRFSQLEQDTEQWRPYVLDALKKFSYDGAEDIYICHDDDILVLGRSWTYKRLDQFLTCLAPKLAPAPAPQELASLFELGVDWPKLRTICGKKIENLEILNAQTKDKKQEDTLKISREETLQTLDKDLISSLAMRRDMRQKPEIMVVEDDPFSQTLVKNALKKHYSVSVNGDGQGAIMSYIIKAPDVLFLDIGLPDMNGHEVLEKIFSLDPDAYVVMFSGNGDKHNILKAIELGAKGFVGKPFTQDKLIQYIEKSPFMQNKQIKETAHGNFIR